MNALANILLYTWLILVACYYNYDLIKIEVHKIIIFIDFFNKLVYYPNEIIVHIDADIMTFYKLNYIER